MLNLLKNNRLSKVIGVICATVMILSALYVPLIISAAGPINSVDITDNKAVVFDFSETVNDSNSNTAAKNENGIGYYGWGWNISRYTDGDITNAVLCGNNQTKNYWSTGGGYRIHTKKADGTYGFYALAPSSKYVVSFKIRVFSSPVSVEGSNKNNTTFVNIGYNSNYNPDMAGMNANFVNSMSTSIPVMKSVIDSNTYTLYDADGNTAVYPCDDTWRTVTYFINTPEEFKYDNALAFFNANYHGSKYEIDDLSVTKIGADSGIIVFRDEYSATDEIRYGNDGEEIDLSKEDISDRATETGHVFEGWYKDSARTEKLDKVTFEKGKETVLYSRWKAPVTVTFKNTLDGSETYVTGMAGEDYKLPSEPTDKENKMWFMGWYKDSNCTIPLAATKFGFANETIYSLWAGEIPGINQDFENYTKDKYNVETSSNGQKVKSNRSIFATTMTKQSEITYDGSGYAVKYHWNPVQINDKNNENWYDTSRYDARDNYFLIGSGLDDNTVYVVSFKYLAEKADAPVTFYLSSGYSENAWANRKDYFGPKDVTLETDGEWHEISFQFTTNYVGGSNSMFLGINNTQNIDTVIYFDNVKIEAFAQPYESVITINTGINEEVINIKGKRGDKIEFPKLTHPDNAPFGGYYLDKGFTTPYESEVFERLPVTLYAQWFTYSGVTQDFENYTKDQWKPVEMEKTYDNGTPDNTEDDVKYKVVYKDNYLIFYSTMTKQSEEKANGNYAVKFHWNTDPAVHKDVTKPDGQNAKNPESFEQNRYESFDNLFYLGKGLENNQCYKITFKYKVEKADQDVKFYVITANGDNSWGGRKIYSDTQMTTLNKTDGWVEHSYFFNTGDLGGSNTAYLGILLSENEEVIMYFDDVKIKSLANASEVVMSLNTNTEEGIIRHIGKRGETVNLPTPVHPDKAKFLGWYVDSACTTLYSETVYPTANVTLYAKWGPYAMSFKEYPYNNDSQNDPNIVVEHKTGIGNGDDHAMHWYVNRKEDSTLGYGTTQAMLIADRMEHDAIYRVKFDYKVDASTNRDLTLMLVSADKANIWWQDITYNYSFTSFKISDDKGKGWLTKEFIIVKNVKNDKNYRFAEELYLRFTGQDQKAGEKIDVLIDNVLVEKVEAPFVYYDAQDGKQGYLVEGEVGEEIKAPKNIRARVGLELVGWCTEPECENKFTLEKYEADTAVKVYAKWKDSSTFIYSFENYTRSDTSAFNYGKVVTDKKTSGEKALYFGDRTETVASAYTIFALEDEGKFYKLETGKSYVLTLNYYIKSYAETNLNISFVGSTFNNFYIGNNSGVTRLTPGQLITPAQAKAQKGKWIKKTFVLDATKLPLVNGTIGCDQIYCSIIGAEGWEFYIDDVAVTQVPKGKVAVAFETDGVKGCPDYLIGKTGQDYSSKVPEILEREGMHFKGYFTKTKDGSYLEKTRGNMIFGETSETIFARFVDYKITENFDTGFNEKAKGGEIAYTIHDFDYEVYDSEKEGNSKDNVTSGRYSLHRKGNSMYKENSVILTLGNQISEGDRYTVTFKVKLGKHLHTDGAVKIVSSRSYQYAWTTTGDYYPVVPIADLADGQWHEVSFTFNSVEAFVSIQTPGYVELFMDDFEFNLVDESVPLSSPKDYTEYVAAERDENGNLVYRDRTAVDISTIIDEGLGKTNFPWIYVFIGAGVLIVAAALVLFLVVFKKKKA